MTKHIDLTAYNTRYELDPARIASANVPEGFKPIKIGGPFISYNGPLFARWTGTRLQLGFRVEDRHCNPLMNCHGGMLASFADMLMPAVAIYQGEGERRFLPTISLQIDYLSGAKLGAAAASRPRTRSRWRARSAWLGAPRSMAASSLDHSASAARGSAASSAE